MWIEALRIEGGVLAGFDQRFSDKLNVLIGGRGTGKSSVIELIRFCLGASSYTESGQQQAIEHALGVLGDGRVTVTLTNGRERIEVSRTAHDTEADTSASDTAPFVFSQAEIESIGLQAHSRLRLIDGFLTDEGEQTSSINSIDARIRSATVEIRTMLAEIDDIAERTRELPKLQEQLEASKAEGAAPGRVHKEIVGHRRALAELTPQVAAARVRSELIGRATDRLVEWSSSLESLLERKPTLEPWPTQAETPDELADLRKLDKQATSRLRAGLDELQAVAVELERKKAAGDSQRTELENRARDIRQKIEEKQKGASVLDKRISDLTQQISVLKSLIGLRQEREERVKRLTDQRSKLLDQRETARQDRTKQREQIALRLSKGLGPTLRVEVSPYSQRRAYVSDLSGALRGSGLHYTELAERIAETYSPQEIAALAEMRDMASIASTLEITEERALRLCSALRGDAGITLFTTNVEDDIELELLDGADYKGIDFLSMGQRCTVVLPIVLQHNERIIILDQPEDHLDNAFVVGTLVKALRARSRSAQSIVATHNPNIPVLGDAALVIHLDSDGSRCFVRSAGSISAPPIVDAITTIMEGGREAFARRAEFYAKNLTNVSKS